MIDRSGRRVLEIQFSRGTLRIGTDPSNDVVLEGADIPPLAAVITPTDDGDTRVRVLDSSHSVRLDRPLVPGDSVAIGDYQLTWLPAAQSAVAGSTRRLEHEEPTMRALHLDLPTGPIQLRPPGPFRVGRKDDCDVFVEADVVSGLHCEVVAEKGAWMVRDLDSTNGTFLDGVRVQTARLPARGVLKLGDLAIPFGAPARSDEHDLAFHGIIGRSAAMQALFRQIEVIAKLDEPVLVHGETGTGKELVASALHTASPRAQRALVVRNCGAIPEALAESELFGSVPGAFSGATNSVGVFEGARGGTVFLDELGELPLSVQPKLLRAIQERRVQRLGEVNERPVDFRLVAATHRDLRSMVDAREFREDLFHRVGVFVLELPPLRARVEDIPLLVDHLLGRPGLVTGAALDKLMQHRWPGNVRELGNVLIRANAFRRGSRIDAEDLSFDLGRRVPAVPVAAPPSDPATDGGSWNKLDDPKVREATLRAWERAGGSLTKAASILGIAKSTMHRRKKYYGLT